MPARVPERLAVPVIVASLRVISPEWFNTFLGRTAQPMRPAVPAANLDFGGRTPGWIAQHALCRLAVKHSRRGAVTILG